MYQPPHFVEDRLEVQQGLIRTHPLGLLISGGGTGLIANPLPFLLDDATPPFGRLVAHLAKANPQWKALADAPDALVVFQGAQSYVTPSWYASKREHGRVVPTWNYAIVQVRGRVRVIHDRDWLHAQVRSLTRRHEAGRAAPWAVEDAPEPFVEGQVKGIVGIELEIASIEGKWKVSQNRPEADRMGVAEGLAAEADAETMVGWVRNGGAIPTT